MTIFGWINALPKLVKWFVGVGLAIVIGILLWWMFTGGWNRISNYFFHREANQLSQEVKDQLAHAAEQKKVLEQTLLELAKSKEELAKATKAREDAEKIFNDTTKTAKEKVAAYEAVMSAAPIHTDPNVTADVLCERARAIGSDPTVIDALCPR